MRQKHKAHNHTLIFTLLIFVAGLARLEAQPAAPSAGSFEERFRFDQSRPLLPPQQSPEQKGPSILDRLLAPPAGAGPAPAPPRDEAAVPAPAAPAAARSKGPVATGPAAGRPIGKGEAAWYEHPGRTASGEKYNPDGLTAAHKTLPFGTRVRVVNLRNQRSVTVRINDRTPPKLKYVIDLSRGSARAIGIKDVGPVALYKLN